MSNIIRATVLPVPTPKEEISIRPGRMEDIPLIDPLQKRYSKNLSFLPTKALEGKIARNEVLVAELVGSSSLVVDSEDKILQTTNYKQPTFLGYLIGQDTYFKHSEVGIIYHLAVEPDRQRGMIGAALLKAQFDRSAYGCKLYCCWCAQDLSANHFYESLGFVALAYRGGSIAKGRTHIFWQKRIRPDDTTTHWWYPHETKGGMMMSDRLVFPIPPGKHWSDELPVIFPQEKIESGETSTSSVGTVKPARKSRRIPIPTKPNQSDLEHSPVISANGLRFAVPKPEIVQTETKIKEKKPREKKPPLDNSRGRKAKNNPQHVIAARELRDRWLERVNENPLCLESAGKYDLTRELPGQPGAGSCRMLEAA